MVILEVRVFLYIIFSLSSVLIFAQQNEIIVNARVVDENNNPVSFADVSNRRQQFGFSANKEGYFTTRMLKSDSLIILKKGHVSSKLMFRDSVQRSEYTVTVILQRVPIELTEVQINAIRTYQQVRQAINGLGVRQTDLHPDAGPLTNPLSFLYEMFSKHEKEKRFTSLLEAEEAKRYVLKDLFRLYNNYNIIDLDEDEYDRFITYLNMPYDYLQHTSDYDLAVSIKRMYAGYSKDKSSSFRKQIYPAALDDLDRVKQIQNSER